MTARPFRCELCNLGWVLRSREGYDMAVRCPCCDGRGSMSIGELARRLDEDIETLCRVISLESRPETAARVFRKVMRRCL